MKSHFRTSKKPARKTHLFETLERRNLFSGLALNTASSMAGVVPHVSAAVAPAGPPTAYLATDLVSDQPGVAPVTDPTLVNAWGISLSPTGGAFWVSANGADLSELYVGDVAGSPISQPFKVAIPGGEPTGQVFNSTTDFSITDGVNTKPAVFIFASESGEITGWNPGLGVQAGASPPSVTAEVGFPATDGAVYKGLALANNGSGNFLYATDFHNGKIDVLDSQFHLTHLAGSFTDPNMPAGFAPFGIATIGGKLYVSYAKQDADKHDDVRGPGNGFIDVFDTNGHMLQRLVSHGDLNSPWGMVQASANFGNFSNALLVGNFGNGLIHAYDPATGRELGTLSEAPGRPIVIDGLWGLAFGNGATAGDANSLYFAAGPDGEAHGLFGKITANPAGTNPVSAALNGDDLVITGSPDSDHVSVDFIPGRQQIVVSNNGQSIGRFDATAVGTIHFHGYAGNDTFIVSPLVSAAVIADGGAGNDVLIGGGGDSMLLGGPGNDVLIGGRGRNVLIGGDGADVLIGGTSDNLLIGGRTAFDANDQALLQILDEWTSRDSFNVRMSKLQSGAGGLPALNSTTIFDDASNDLILRGLALNWVIR